MFAVERVEICKRMPLMPVGVFQCRVHSMFIRPAPPATFHPYLQRIPTRKLSGSLTAQIHKYRSESPISLNSRDRPRIAWGIFANHYV